MSVVLVLARAEVEARIIIVKFWNPSSVPIIEVVLSQQIFVGLLRLNSTDLSLLTQFGVLLQVVVETQDLILLRVYSSQLVLKTSNISLLLIHLTLEVNHLES